MNVPSSTASTRHLGLAAAVAVLVVAAAWWLLRTGDDEAQSQVDESTTAAQCGPVLRQPTNGAGAHVNDATYDSAPPSFGDHASRWEVRANTFYTVQNRPDVSLLVHNLEHGYNILWYDQTIINDHDALAQVQEIADGYATLGHSPDPANAFIAAPWTADDGAAFPEGMHFALTHWYADPSDPTGSRADEAGLTRYCPDISADIVEDWMTDHPLTHAPEGHPNLM